MADLPDRTEEEKQQRINPYDAAILSQTLRMQHLRESPQEAMFTPEELGLRQAKNAYNQQMGGLMSLSGDPRTSAFGGTILKQAMDEAKLRQTEHGEFDPMSGQHRYFPAYLRQQELTRGDQQLDRLTREREAAETRNLLQQNRLDAEGPLRAARAELAQAQAEAKRLATEVGKPLSASEAKDIKQKSADYDALSQVAGLMKDFEAPFMNLAKVGKFTDWWSKEVAPEGMLANEDWTKQRKLQEAMQKIVLMRERHANFGASVTATERPYWNAAIPSRGEDPTKWLEMNMQVLERELGKEIRAATQAGYNKGQIRELVPAAFRDLVTAPGSGGMAGALDAVTAPPQQPGGPPQPGAYPVLRPGAGGLSY